MKVGTDGVLLGAWADVSKYTNEKDTLYSIIDIGCGTGIIALMLAQRASLTHDMFQIDAVEIDTSAAEQAQENFEASPWSKHITIHSMSMQEYEQKEDSRKFDLIVSNPPFYNATLKPDDKGRAIARHKDALHISEIVRFARERLENHGKLALIYPTDYDSEVMTAAVLLGLHPVRICDILTKVGKPCKRRMTEFSSDNLPLLREQLTIRNADGKYTDEYRRLTDEFYLHLTD